ncbi:threonine/serine exporter family protein [Plebeiibacterium sediminum]|uniref:Threonine/serine exporter family protein n=1 Tax=Plebeiibacterium sediminum TaxID=2992112 RepID=A0AAE3M8Q7_9BACT|nr:threonine/serine exporter family protein [Plebeiobacterium sediminum]MCW3789037.1 threonine/serine exporter family protein [Plebeiobacterium sediminum]
MDILQIIERMIWPGLAAVGFAILFNVPQRTLLLIFGMGAACGVTKFMSMELGLEVVLATFLAAIVVGFLSIPAADNKHSPMYVFAIPSIISMIPGAFSYRAMLGLIKLTGHLSTEEYIQVMQETTSNGLKAVFVLLSIAVGVSMPMILLRHDSAQEIMARIVKSRE